jgi:hypothetical protein
MGQAGHGWFTKLEHRMNAKEVIKEGLKSTQQTIGQYLGDLSDADLIERPVPNANHIAWQMGHMIVGEIEYFGKRIPASTTYPTLPPGFKEQHGNDMAAQNPPKGFFTKQEYLTLFNQARDATVAAVDKLTDADLDKPTGEKWAPTVGILLVQAAIHTLMHGGQFTVVRRKLGKPIVM